jgi:transposase-like protein
MDDLSRFCCQNPECGEYGNRGLDNLYVRDHYGKDKLRRLLCCKICDGRFGETRGTVLFASKLPLDKCVAILEHLAEGCGIRRTARLVHVNRKAVELLSKKAGGHAKSLHDELVAFSPCEQRNTMRREMVVRCKETGELRSGRPG